MLQTNDLRRQTSVCQTQKDSRRLYQPKQKPNMKIDQSGSVLIRSYKILVINKQPRNTNRFLVYTYFTLSLIIMIYKVARNMSETIPHRTPARHILSSMLIEG